MQYIPIDQWLSEGLLSQSIELRNPDSKQHIDTLRFVGQGVLKERVIKTLTGLFPFASLEDMSRINSSIMSNENLANVALSLKLEKKMKLEANSKKMLVSAIESILGELEQKRKPKDADLFVRYIIYRGVNL